jgi:Uma2 family endonuclease
MNTKIAVKNNTKTIPPPTNGKKEIYYPTEERKKMGETDYQHIQISILEQMLRVFFAERKDVYLASDLIVYYGEGNPNRRFAPDLMICLGVENRKRRTYKLWEEKTVPQVVIEVVSKETWQKDVTTKRRLYEKLGVQEYYVIDPEYKYLPTPLFAYRLEFGELVRQSVADTRIFSPLLGLELVDTGEDFRFFDVEKKKFLPTINKVIELQREIERLKKLIK